MASSFPKGLKLPTKVVAWCIWLFWHKKKEHVTWRMEHRHKHIFYMRHCDNILEGLCHFLEVDETFCCFLFVSETLFFSRQVIPVDTNTFIFVGKIKINFFYSKQEKNCVFFLVRRNKARAEKWDNRHRFETTKKKKELSA